MNRHLLLLLASLAVACGGTSPNPEPGTDRSVPAAPLDAPQSPDAAHPSDDDAGRVLAAPSGPDAGSWADADPWAGPYGCIVGKPYSGYPGYPCAPECPCRGDLGLSCGQNTGQHPYCVCTDLGPSGGYPHSYPNWCSDGDNGTLTGCERSDGGALLLCP